MDKFEARSSDGIFLGYANHSRAYRVLNLETNQIMETCEVTFDETKPCSSVVFECAGDDEMDQTIFEDEKEDGEEDDEDGGVPVDPRVPPTSTTVDGGPSPTRTSTHQHEQGQDRVEAATEGEAISRHEAPRRVQADHPPSKSLETSMNILHGRGPGTFLTLLILFCCLFRAQRCWTHSI